MFSHGPDLFFKRASSGFQIGPGRRGCRVTCLCEFWTVPAPCAGAGTARVKAQNKYFNANWICRFDPNPEPVPIVAKLPPKSRTGQVAYRVRKLRRVEDVEHFSTELQTLVLFHLKTL